MFHNATWGATYVRKICTIFIVFNQLDLPLATRSRTTMPTTLRKSIVLFVHVISPPKKIYIQESNLKMNYYLKGKMETSKFS